MKIKKKVIVRCVADEYILVPVGDAVAEYNGLFVMSESGMFLWNMIENGAEKDELILALMKEYEINSETAVKDVTEFIQMLCDLEIAE